MARPMRIERVGGWYHVTARGNERRDIYSDDRDRRHFLELVQEMVNRFRVRVHAYVLMNNHYHLMVELREVSLSRAFQWLNVSYSVWFNRRHGRSGHLFQGRFKSVAVSRETWGLELSRYVHLNPVRVKGLGLGKAERGRSREGAGVTPTAEVVRERIGRLRAYRWSSYRAYIGLERQPDWLECDEVRSLGGRKEKELTAKYREYVETAVREGLKMTPWESVRDQVILGPREFWVKLKKEMKEGGKGGKELERLMPGRPDWRRVVEYVEQVKGEKWESFRERHGDSGRDLAVYLARREGGMTLMEIGRQAGLKSDAAVAVTIRRYAQRLVGNTAERRRLAEAAEMLGIRS